MRKRSLFILASVWLITAIGWSCQVPVFRYALERWSAENYRLVVMHKKPLSETLQRDLITLQSQLVGDAVEMNMSLKVVDVAELDEKARGALAGAGSMKSDPWMVLTGPGGDVVVHAAALTSSGLSAIHSSPARDVWLEKILSGASVVWLIIPGEDQQDLGNASKLLQAALTRAEKEITIPEGVINPKDRHQVDEAEMDAENVLRSGIPLKIQFPMQVVDRKDPREAIFISMLTQGLPEAEQKETLIVPLFGRGRMLPPIPASRLSAQMVMQACSYLCGACSCTVKEDNPGRDVVIKQLWQEHLNEGLVAVEKALPPLEGVGDLAIERQDVADEKELVAKPSTKQFFYPIHGLYVALAILALLLLGSILIKSKSKN